jgi:hypothetical protein
MTILIEHGPDRPRVYAFREDGRRTFPHVPLAQRLPYVLGRMEPNFPLPALAPNDALTPMLRNGCVPD